MNKHFLHSFTLVSAALLVTAGCGGGGGNPAKNDGSVDGDAGGGDTVTGTDTGTDTGAPDTRDAGAPVDGGGDGAGGGDGGAPTMLTATIVSRRQTSVQLTWPAPSNGGQAVTGYQVRYAKVAITTANFDDASVTTAVPFTGTPKAPGAAESLLVSNLYIENGYYFAVAGTDGAGNRLGLMATATAVKASFLVSLLPAPAGPTTQLFGAGIDGAADVNGDNLSDLLVATSNDTRAYLYFGSATFAPTAPGVTFTGAMAGFGSTIRHIGDIDRDGLADIAIADPAANRVVIYKGRMTWPLTLADTAADYVISTDASWAASAFGYAIAPVGDFDGDGADDFVIGAPGFATRVGRVVVIYGRTGFSSFGLPNNTRSLEIGGDPALDRSQFGLAATGLGHFYSVTTGTTLVVSAPGLGAATSTSDNEGRIYAFHGRAPGAAIAATAADHVRTGPGKGARIGQTLVNLGQASLGSGNSGDGVTASGVAGTGYLLSGSAAAGPMANLVVLTQSGSTGGGQVLFGGGFSGRDITASLIGDTRQDVALMSLSSATAVPSTLDIIDGTKVSGLGAMADTTARADVHVPMPAGWLGTATGISPLIRDLDGDGFADFALGDQFGLVPGRVAVFR